MLFHHSEVLQDRIDGGEVLQTVDPDDGVVFALVGVVDVPDVMDGDVGVLILGPRAVVAFVVGVAGLADLHPGAVGGVVAGVFVVDEALVVVEARARQRAAGVEVDGDMLAWLSELGQAVRRRSFKT